jgi:hypothetical protein
MSCLAPVRGSIVNGIASTAPIAGSPWLERGFAPCANSETPWGMVLSLGLWNGQPNSRLEVQSRVRPSIAHLLKVMQTEETDVLLFPSVGNRGTDRGESQNFLGRVQPELERQIALANPLRWGRVKTIQSCYLRSPAPNVSGIETEIPLSKYKYGARFSHDQDPGRTRNWSAGSDP